METLPFSYIWFKYDILSVGWYKLRSVTIRVPDCKPTYPGSTPAGGADAWNRRICRIDGYGDDKRESVFVCFKTFHYS